MYMNLEDDGIQCFTFLRSWYAMYREMDKEDRMAFMDAIMAFAFEDKALEKGSVSKVVEAALEKVFPIIDMEKKIMISMRRR